MKELSRWCGLVVLVAGVLFVLRDIAPGSGGNGGGQRVSWPYADVLPEQYEFAGWEPRFDPPLPRVMGWSPHLAQADEVCVDDADLVSWLRASPGSKPGAGVSMILRGERAAAYLRAAGGAVLTAAPRVLYFVTFPVSHPELYLVVAADEAGCVVNMAGERVPDVAAPGAEFASATYTRESTRLMFKELGLPWPKNRTKRHKPRPRLTYYPTFGTQTVAL